MENIFGGLERLDHLFGHFYTVGSNIRISHCLDDEHEFFKIITSIPRIFFRRWINGAGARGLVNMSEGMSTVIKCFITITNFSYNSLMRLYRTPICLVFLPLHLFSTMLIVDLLSSNRVVGFI